MAILDNEMRHEGLSFCPFNLECDTVAWIQAVLNSETNIERKHYLPFNKDPNFMELSNC